MGSRVISPQRFVDLHQLDVNFYKINNILWASNKQSRYWNRFFDSWRLHLRRHILDEWCDEYVMIHYNRNNNAYCRAVNAETFKTIEHNPVWTSILLYTRNPYSYSHFEIVICIYSVRGDIWPNVNKYIHLYHLQRIKCLHFCLHIDWNPYSTFKDSCSFLRPGLTEPFNYCHEYKTSIFHMQLCTIWVKRMGVGFGRWGCVWIYISAKVLFKIINTQYHIIQATSNNLYFECAQKESSA